MSVISDIIIADQSEATNVGRCLSPSNEWEGFSFKILDPVNLGGLWGILTKVSGVDEVVALAGRFTLLYQASDEGPWVYGVPPEFQALLAELSAMEPERLQAVTRQWSETEELEGWELEEVEFVLQEMADLADTARLQNKPLLLWLSL